jgi:hypothetical protein
MLASTMQFPNNNPHHTSHTHPQRANASAWPEPDHRPGTTTPTPHHHPTPPTKDRIRSSCAVKAAGPVVPGPNSVPTPQPIQTR